MATESFTPTSSAASGLPSASPEPARLDAEFDARLDELEAAEATAAVDSMRWPILPWAALFFSVVLGGAGAIVLRSRLDVAERDLESSASALAAERAQRIALEASQIELSRRITVVESRNTEQADLVAQWEKIVETERLWAAEIERRATRANADLKGVEITRSDKVLELQLPVARFFDGEAVDLSKAGLEVLKVLVPILERSDVPHAVEVHVDDLVASKSQAAALKGGALAKATSLPKSSAMLDDLVGLRAIRLGRALARTKLGERLIVAPRLQPTAAGVEPKIRFRLAPAT